LTLYGLRATINKTPPSVIRPVYPAAPATCFETKVPRMAWKPRLPHCRFWLVCAGLVLAGCQEQEPIREYTVAKEPPPRLLAVMAPREDSTWFFKLMGPADEVGKHVQAFDDFVNSVHFTGRANAPIEWKVPKEWDEEHSEQKAYAVLRFAGEGMPLGIAVTHLGGKAGGLHANVDRWRVQQLGLEPIGDDELKQLDGNIKVDGKPATRVDFVASGLGKGRRSVAPRPRVAEGPSFTFSKPDDWEKMPADARGFVKREAVFQIKRKGLAAQATVVRAGGDSRQNVNRWRNELGLAPVTEAELAKELRSLDTLSGRADYVELTGRDGDGERMTLGAWLTHGGQTWFITMKGPAELIRQQKPAFEAFVKSFRLGGGAGVAHE
jgi:hypothetical protein